MSASENNQNNKRQSPSPQLLDLNDISLRLSENLDFHNHLQQSKKLIQSSLVQEELSAPGNATEGLD